MKWKKELRWVLKSSSGGHDKHLLCNFKQSQWGLVVVVGWSQGGKEEKMEMKCKWFEFSGVGDESCGGRHLLKGLIKSFNGVQTSRS